MKKKSPFASISMASRAASWPCPSTGRHRRTTWRPRASSSTPPRRFRACPDRFPARAPAIHVFDLKERKDHVLIDGVQRFALSFDGSSSSTKPTADATATPTASSTPSRDGPNKVGDGALNLVGMKVQVDPAAEWKQMFNEVWRQERDYFFEAAMNGVDWAKERDKYAPLLPYVADRYDLTYMLGEMIGELSNSHTYVGGGDYPDLNPVNVGLLGVDFEPTPPPASTASRKSMPARTGTRSRARRSPSRA